MVVFEDRLFKNTMIQHIKRNFVLLALIFVALYLGILPFIPRAQVGIGDGENANDELGQYDGANLLDPQPIYTKNSTNNTPNRFGFSSPQYSTMDSVNHRFFVSDKSNNRVLVYNLNTDNTFPDRVPDNVLGQSDFVSNTAATTQAGMSSPRGLAYDAENNRLFVVDNSNNRVLIFDLLSITDGQNASYVLGQTDFITSTSGTTQSKFNNPLAVAYDAVNHRLFVSQFQSNRVTVFSLVSLANGQNADYVLGQPDFTTSTGGTTQGKMNSPIGVDYDSNNNRLFVVDSLNNRVLIYDVSTINNGQNAVNVLGQTDFTTATSGTTQGKMNSPQGIAYDSENNRLFVSHFSSNRVLLYNLAEVTNGQDAVNVLGQTDFTTATSGTTQSKMNGPVGLFFDGSNHYLFVAQTGNHRITVYDVSTIADGQEARDLLGQYDGTSISDPQPVYTKNGSNDTPNRLGFNAVQGMIIDQINHHFFVSDTSNNRVLVFNLNTNNTFPDRIPDYVLGQPDFISITAATTQAGMNAPRGLAFDADNNRLFVAQTGNHRVTVYDVSTITNGQNAINVLGQPDFTTGTSATTQAGMNGVRGLAYDSENHRLFVVQASANRVTVYDVSSITNGENAVYVLGQADFTSSSTGITQNKLNSPQAVEYDDGDHYLFVADSSNNRVLIYTVETIANNQSPVYVLGQTDFVTSSSGTTQSKMSSPQAIVFDQNHQRLFVASSGIHRVTV